MFLASSTSLAFAKDVEEVKLPAKASLFIDEGWLVFDGTVSARGHLVFHGVNGNLSARVKADADIDLFSLDEDTLPIPYSSFSAHVWGRDELGMKVNQNIDGTVLFRVVNGQIVIAALISQIPVPLPPL